MPPEDTLHAIDVAIRKCERSGIKDLTVGLRWHHYVDLLTLAKIESTPGMFQACEGRRGDELNTPLPVKTVRKIPIRVQCENRDQSWVFGRVGRNITGWAVVI